MSGERDIFISYAFLDNLAVREGTQGWVEDFHKVLGIRLTHLLKERPQICYYSKKTDCDIFTYRIDENISKSAIMVIILSPEYSRSECCVRELKAFMEAAASEIGEKKCTKPRIFKILKSAPPPGGCLPEIENILGYEFYITDSSTGRVKELNQESAGELDQIYLARLDDVAHDICDALERMKQMETTGIPAEEKRLKIYLAETSSDLKAQRDIIRRELHENGYDVLPDCQLPMVGVEFRKQVKKFLDRCKLSIHLVGANYGVIPEGDRVSIVELQNELAVEKSKAGQLQRLIWKPPGNGAIITDEQQKRFIDMVRTSPEIQFGADMFETPLKDFKYAIRDKIKHIESAPAVMMSKPTVFVAETIYALKEHRERIKECLIDQGYRVLPEQPLPMVYPKLVESLDNLLDQCDISIHLLGDIFGSIPEETDKSIIFVQNEQAAKRSRQGKLVRLVRLSPTISQTDEKQRLFIENLKKEAGAKTQPNDDIFEAALDDLETVIFEKLKVIEEEKRRKGETGKESIPTVEGYGIKPLQIYLICDRRDLDNITEMEDFLYSSGYNVLLPVFEGDEEELIRDHNENLKCCDAAVVYYGAGNDLWMRAITRDFQKIAGYGRTQPMLGKAVFLAPPVSVMKERFRLHDWMIINGLEGFSPGIVEPWTKILEVLGK